MITKWKVNLIPGQAILLVNLANRCDFDVDISYDHVTLDAKSILGVMSIDFRHSLIVTYYGEDSCLEDFLNEHAA